MNQYLIANARRERSFAFTGLNFTPGSAEIQDVERSDIASLAQVLAALPGVRAAVVGHADGRGEGAAGARLGARRAQAVVAALGERGVDTSNITARSGVEENAARNRPTEFILLAR